MTAIYAIWNNFIRIHKTLRVTSAMAAVLSKTAMTWEGSVALKNADAAKPSPRGPHKKKGSEQPSL
jgi:hypothetical protein